MSILKDVKAIVKKLLSYCGLVDARISAPEKDLPVPKVEICHKYFSDKNLKSRHFERPMTLSFLNNFLALQTRKWVLLYFGMTIYLVERFWI